MRASLSRSIVVRYPANAASRRTEIWRCLSGRHRAIGRPAPTAVRHGRARVTTKKYVPVQTKIGRDFAEEFSTFSFAKRRCDLRSRMLLTASISRSITREFLLDERRQ
jgi:hypothetical protein